MKEGFSIGDKHRMAMWNPSLLSQLLLADWLKIVWINQQSIVPVQSTNNAFL